MLTVRDLNRTLLRRQHLLERTSMPALDMVHHLLGLQAQENLPPYLSLAARIDGFQPRELSDALERKEAVRFLTMRGTVHVLTPHDALTLRAWVQPALDRQTASNQNTKEARHLPVEDVVAAAVAILAGGPLPVKQLGERLAEAFPGVPGNALAHIAREHAPMVQVPPRGMWKRSGGVVYQTVDNHLGLASALLDVPETVRRYLRAFGPVTPSDMTTWSGVTRLAPVFASMKDELIEVACEDGRKRYDLPDAPYGSEDEHAPVRLLGTYDNIWLSHADRSHVSTPEMRAAWMGVNGGIGNVLFVDGFVGGIWWWRDDKVELNVLVPLTRAQQGELDEEVERVTGLLSS